ncbi:MAG: hypothetical protein OXG35_26870, partial [Acidobacteria bacterium]|nr:hypothetical protein [Acidobacteriota bacterium]
MQQRKLWSILSILAVAAAAACGGGGEDAPAAGAEPAAPALAPPTAGQASRTVMGDGGPPA